MILRNTSKGLFVFGYTVILLTLAACGKDKPLEVRDKVQTLFVKQSFHNGFEVEREYLIHQPPTLNTDQQYPVVFGFHGGGEVNDYWIEALRPLIDSGAFIGIYPQGYLNSWNLGQEASKLDDTEFVNEIIEVIDGLNYLDMDRVYAIGYSNGAGLVNQLVLETNHFSAVAPCAGQLIQDQEPLMSTEPVSIYQICGRNDTIIPYAGGFSTVSNHVYIGSKESLSIWASSFSCDATSQLEFFNSDTMIVFSDCAQDLEMRLHTIEGFGHDWHYVLSFNRLDMTSFQLNLKYDPLKHNPIYLCYS